MKQRRRERLKERDGPGCLVCGMEDELLTIHHIVKRCDNGSNDMDNLCLLCEPCHVIYHQNEPPDFYLWVSQMKRYLYTFGIGD